MVARIIYIHKDPCGGAYWFTDIYFASDRPYEGDRVMLTPQDVASSTQAFIPRGGVYRWEIESPVRTIDYEVSLKVPNLEGDDNAGTLLDWLTTHGFEQRERSEYAELFGIPELAERFPPPSEA